MENLELIVQWKLPTFVAPANTPWLSIMPDMQYIMKPGGRSNIQDAVVLGAQLEITF
ncbi:MAG: carbohydrate porin [Dissulfurispiraceae bacterium]